jgi:hypothetical protein
MHTKRRTKGHTYLLSAQGLETHPRASSKFHLVHRRDRHKRRLLLDEKVFDVRLWIRAKAEVLAINAGDVDLKARRIVCGLTRGSPRGLP